MDQPNYADTLFDDRTVDKQVNETLPKNTSEIDDEDISVWKILKEDFSLIGIKIFHVLIPHSFSANSKGSLILKNWDLWGPFLISLIMAISMSLMTDISTSIVLPFVFVLPWVGSAIITINGLLIGGIISFFQTVSLVGYCVFPLALASLALCVLKKIIKSTLAYSITRFVLCSTGFIWGTLASYAFFSGVVPPSRHFLAIYPLFLFYSIISWFLLATSYKNDSTV